MNKELEEAKKILNHYLEMEEFDNAGDFLIVLDIVLKALDNSISKEVIENKLNYWNNRLKEDKRMSWMLRDKTVINVLQELLEGK